MPTWTNIPNAAVAQGGRPRGSVVTALRDNPVAIAEGAAGAPRIVPDARFDLLADIDPRDLAEVVITDLPPSHLVFEFETLQPSSSSDRALELQISFDNGSSWSGTLSLSQSGNYQATGVGQLGGLSGFVRLYSSLLESLVQVPIADDISSSTEAPQRREQRYGNVAHAKPYVRMNAIKFFWNAGSFRDVADQRIRLYGTGCRLEPKP